MIGILFTLFNIGVAAADGISKAVQTNDGIKRAYERKANGIEDYNTYFDYRGVRRDLNTHEIRNVDFAIVESDGKDRCVRDVHGNVVRNLTEEEADKRKQKAIAMGRTTYLYRKYGNGIYNGSYHRDHGGDGFCDGAQFKDLKTGQIYVGRMFYVRDPALKGDGYYGGNTMYFYMDLKGLLVREADCEMLKRKRGERVPSEENVMKFIAEFNDKQLYGNGYNGWKDRMYRKDAFGNISGKDEYAFNKYYCNDSQARQDV